MSTKTKKFKSTDCTIIKEAKMTPAEEAMLREINAVKEVTGLVDMGCDFKEGKCISERNVGKIGGAMCCCKNCADACGYLPGTTITDRQYKLYCSGYDVKTGFWRPDVGCILPRKDRSATCVFYACSASLAARHVFHPLKDLCAKLVKALGDQYKARNYIIT